jgi:thymidylate kinase
MRRMILVEGLDLAGKSTLVEALHRHYAQQGIAVRVGHGGFSAANPVEEVARSIMRTDEQFTGVEAGSLFLSSMLWDARHYEAWEGVHIQDSSWLRTLAFEQLYGSPALAHLMEEQGRLFPRFDAAIFLTASLPERQRRLQTRAVNDVHDLLAFKKPDKFLAIERRLLDLVREWEHGEVIDTDGLTPAEVLERALARVQAAGVSHAFLGTCTPGGETLPGVSRFPGHVHTRR